MLFDDEEPTYLYEFPIECRGDELIECGWTSAFFCPHSKQPHEYGKD